MKEQGWMSSVAVPPSLGHSVGLGFIKNGDTRMVQIVRVVSPVHGTEMEVEIVSARAAGYVDVTCWQLTDRWGNVLIIPAGAEGSDAMVDSFAALSGVKYDLIIAAMAAADEAVFTIWKKTG